MNDKPPKARTTSLDRFEALLAMLELAARVGLISGAALAAALGQVVLAALLGLIALGVFLRFKRRRKPRAP